MNSVREGGQQCNDESLTSGLTLATELVQIDLNNPTLIPELAWSTSVVSHHGVRL